MAGAEARLRPRFVMAHLVAVHRALREGVPVKGYCYQQRRVKPSGWLYAAICRAGGIPLAYTPSRT
jgi:beta-glucosidase/6-phospho-beta-glucosidase/beta-galactosidase